MLDVTRWNFVVKSAFNEEIVVAKNRNHDFTYGSCAFFQYFHHFPAFSCSDERDEFEVQGFKTIINYEFK